MASVLRCDGCNKEATSPDGRPAEHAVGWWQLGRIGPDFTAFGEPQPRTYHLCSLECVQGLALAMLARREQRVPL